MKFVGVGAERMVAPETFGAGAALADAIRAPLTRLLLNFFPPPHPQPIISHLSRAVLQGAYASPSFEE